MRINADLWVKAYIRRIGSEGAAAFVVRRGDEHGGSVFIRVNGLDGTSELYGPAIAGLTEIATERRWSLRKSDADAAIEAMIAQELRFDSDLWLIEVEDRQHRHFLDEYLISE